MGVQLMDQMACFLDITQIVLYRHIVYLVVLELHMHIHKYLDDDE
jgi:hypothetical protein